MDVHKEKILLMGYIDGELSAEEARQVEAHINECPECRSELERFRKLKEVTDEMEFITPEDKLWERYWSGGYRKLERKLGWLILGIGAAFLAVYGMYHLLFGIWQNTDIPLVIKLPLFAAIIGILVLFISITRERLYFRRETRYKNVRR